MKTHTHLKTVTVALMTTMLAIMGACSAGAALFLDVGTFNLAPDTAGQQIQFYFTADAPTEVAGLEFNIYAGSVDLVVEYRPRARLAPSFAVAVALIFCVGAASAAFQAMNNSLVLTSVPVEYHGRMQSLLMLSFSGFGLAALPLGIVADALGLRETLVIMGAVVVAVSTWSLVRRGDGPDATDIASGPVSSDAATDPAGEVRR